MEQRREPAGRGRGGVRQQQQNEPEAEVPAASVPRPAGRGRASQRIVQAPVGDIVVGAIQNLQIQEQPAAAPAPRGRGRGGVRGRGAAAIDARLGDAFAPDEIINLQERAAIPPPFPVADVAEEDAGPRTPPGELEERAGEHGSPPGAEAPGAEQADPLMHVREDSPRSTHENEARTGIPEVSHASGSVGASLQQRLLFEETMIERSEPVKCIGNKGTPITVASNYLRLDYDHKLPIHEYHVSIEPPMDNIKYMRKTLDQFAEQLGAVRNFDGVALFLPIQLNAVTTLHGMHPIDVSVPIEVTIRYVKQKEAHELVHFFNILLKKLMRVIGFTPLRDNYYNLTDAKKLPTHKLEVWPGFAVAVDEREDGLMICLDSSHRVLRTDTVLDSLNGMRGQSSHWHAEANKFLVGKIVLTRYNNMCYKIDDISWDESPLSTFPKGKTEINYVDYYKSHHGKDIRDHQQPLVLSKMKPRRNDPIQEEKIVALIPELCYITGLTDELRANFTVMKDLGEHTRLAPAQRKLVVENFIGTVNDNPDAKQVLSNWNLTLHPNPVSIDARQMLAPKLSFGRLKDVAVRADFSKESGSNCHEPCDIRKYLLISTQRDAPVARRFCDTYRQVAQALRITTTEGATLIQAKGMSVPDFRKAIIDNLKPDIQFVVCLLPQPREDMYGMVKKTCVSEHGIPSQVILTKTLSNEKRFRSVIVKVALQINCKLGGAIWSLTMPKAEEVMFVGIDVAHDPLRRHPSVVALVASLNNEMTRYFSTTKVLKVQQEVTDSLKPGMKDLLQQYYAERGVFPGRIVVFRDGGNSSSLKLFKEHEAVQVQASADEMCPGTKFSFVIVQKRIAQRFFQIDRSGCKNPEPGSVIDHSVTLRDTYDFFVVSQLVRQGTVTPTHYCVVADTHNTSPDLMQKYAYATSFMYFNWPGTVRVPAVTQYAHKLCSLVHNHVKAPPSSKLMKTLYYL